MRRMPRLASWSAQSSKTVTGDTWRVLRLGSPVPRTTRSPCSVPSMTGPVAWIVGGETDSQAWEILMAILLGETAFGVGGVVMGPIIYAFVKRELRDRSLV